MHFVIFRDTGTDKPWRWMLRGANGAILTIGNEFFKRKDQALAAVHAIQSEASGAAVLEPVIKAKRKKASAVRMAT